MTKVTPPNDADKELREALTDIMFKAAGGITDMAKVEINDVMQLIQADRKRTRQAVLDEVLAVLPKDDIVMSKYGYNSDEKKYGFRIGITEVKQAITALKGGKA